MSVPMLLSFYCDDTSPYTPGAGAFGAFLDYCAEHGIRGEASCILGIGGHSMARDPDAGESAFLGQVRRAFDCGIDTHMEIMTHGGLFDFGADCVPEGAIHEGLWLHEPDVTVAHYEDYFRSILDECDRAGVRFTGLTWPGCGCEACTTRYAELRAAGITDPNPNVWQALLRLAQQGRFRGKTIPCFFGSSETDFGAHPKASGAGCAVYDLMPNAGDRFGIWENTPALVDPDYYITDDGERGIIPDHLRAGAPYCIWYAHWQGLNPATGAGWRAFTTVIDRIERHLAGTVEWCRPSELPRQI